MIGKTIGRIHIDAALGAGGMGEVYAGYDETLGRRVAVKAIRSPRRGDERQRNRLLREARALSRLDHPNICRLWDYVEGEDVDLLVLELIEGRTLSAMVETGLTFKQKVRIAREIADVLVVAHRQGIVHRDLKPDNVMITKSGEVKVLDFGLARFLRDEGAVRPRPIKRAASTEEIEEADDVSENDPTATLTIDPAAQPDATTRTPSNPDLDTMQGVAVGTPRFMSPEQARGESISTASDMFSFGMLLAHLFSGRAPNEDIEDSGTLLAFAAAGKVDRVTGVDGEVTALIDSLRQPARSDRPTASDALARLTKIEERSARRIRMAVIATLLLVAVIAIAKYTVDLRSERAIADAARIEAQERRKDADELIAFMLGDLRGKLEKVGKLDVLDAASEKALSYFDSLDPETLSSVELARNAKALYQLGEVRRAQGNLAAATTAYDRSLDLARKAVERDPSNTDLRMELGAAEFYVGVAYRYTGDWAATRVHFQNYETIARELVAMDPDNPTFQTELGYAEGNLGLVDEAEGKLDDASERYIASLEINQRLAEGDPDNEGLRYNLAASHNKLGLVQFKRALVEEARNEFREEMEIRKALLAKHPDNIRQRERLAHSYWFRSSVEAVTGNYDEAAKLLEADLEIFRELTARDPENADWQRHYGSHLQSLAEMREAQGRRTDRDRALKQAHQLLAGVVAKDSARPDWHRDLAKTETAEARAALNDGNPSAALTSADSALDRLEKYPGGEISDIVAVGEARLARGEALATLGRRTEAEAEWRRVLALQADSPGEPESRLVDVLVRAAFLLGDQATASPMYERLQHNGYASPNLRALCARIQCS